MGEGLQTDTKADVIRAWVVGAVCSAAWMAAVLFFITHIPMGPI